MRCDAHAYAGWLVRDSVTAEKIERVLWVDPEAKTYCTLDEPVRLVGNEVATTEHRCTDIVIDLAATTFWVTPAPVTVAPLSPGRQQDQEPSDQPCPECCQPTSCRRTSWCAAHRGPFGEAAP